MHPLRTNDDPLIDLLVGMVDDTGDMFTSTLLDSAPYEEMTRRGWLFRTQVAPHVLKFVITDAGKRAAEPYRNSPPA